MMHTSMCASSIDCFMLFNTVLMENFSKFKPFEKLCLEDPGNYNGSFHFHDDMFDKQIETAALVHTQKEIKL